MGKAFSCAGGAPVEVAAVDDYAAHGRAVTAYPFGRTVYDYVCAVGDWLAEVAAGAEGVVDLCFGKE